MITIRSIILALTLLGSIAPCYAQNIFFWNKAYASNLEIQTAIATSDQLNQLLQDKSTTLDWFHQNPPEELGNKDAYVFIRIRNIGHKAAWGTLAVSVNYRRPFDIGIPFVQSSKSWQQYIIYESGIYMRGHTPTVTTRWKMLYAK